LGNPAHYQIQAIQKAEETMKNHKQSNFFWCPVCMVHTYHKQENRGWECLNDDHQIFLRLRRDPWIEQYRASRPKAEVALGKTS
jgi:hypothetical protein